MNNAIKKLISILFWSFIFILLFSNGSRYLDHDLGWHLKVGEEISETKQVPHIEHYDHTLEGQSWVDHEWGINYISYLIYENGSYFSLMMFFTVIAFVSFYFLYLFIIKNNQLIFQSNYLLKIYLFILILLGVYASLPHLGVRMQELTILNIIFLLVIIDSYTKKKNFKILLFLPVLFLVWANVHAGFLIGLFLLVSFIFVKLFESVSYKHRKLNFLKYNNLLNKRELSIFVAFSILSLGATFVNPYGINLYGFLGSYSNSFYLTNIMEWLPFYSFPILYKQLVYVGISISVFLIYLFSTFGKKNKKVPLNFDIWDIFLFLLFIYLAQKSRRHFPLFFVATLPFIFSLSIGLFNDSFQQFKKMVNLRIVAFFVVVILFLSSLNNLAKINFCNDPFEAFCTSFPCGAVDYLKNNDNLQNKTVFNEYAWGGYFIWTLPDMKLFIDGRLPQFEFNGHTMLEEYKEFSHIDKIENKLNEHKVEMIIIKTAYDTIHFSWFEKNILLFDEEAINTRKNDLKEFLINSQEWENVFEDRVSMIYIKL